MSTCGIVENIRRLADEKMQITLALSLHASSQEKRKELMPIAYKYELKDVLDACRYYFAQTGRRITFEYSLVPVNPIKERSYIQPDRSAVEAFKNKLEKYRINVTIRREMGRDIGGACGQLRKSYIEEQRKETGV